MNTTLTIVEIEQMLHDSILWNKRTDIMIPNVSWGLLDHEADFLILSKTGYLTEIEIKRSWEDFKADFKKKHKHDDEKIYRFAYCLPISIKDKVANYYEQIAGNWYEKPHILYYNENAEIEQEAGGCWESPGYHRKLFLEEKLTLMRLINLRYWNLRHKKTI